MKNQNLNEKNYNQILNETYDLFASQGVSIIGEGFKEIATSAALSEQYIDSLTEGSSANHVETMKQLMRNSNRQILVESSTTGIMPIASLSMPVIRKLWPKFALKEAVKEEVAKSPRFVVSYTKPYLFRGKADGTEEKVMLPSGLKTGSALSEAGKKEIVKRTVKLTPALPNSVIDFAGVASAEYPTTGSEAEKAIKGTGRAFAEGVGSALKVQPLDRDFMITKVTLGATVKTVRTGLDINNTCIVDIKDATHDITILARVDLQHALVKLSVIGLAVGATAEVEIFAPISSEYNEKSWSVAFDIDRRDIVIPTGQHINAPLPIEALQDMMALYQIDGTKETVDLMTNVFANKLDLDVISFLATSYSSQPGKIYSELPGAEEYTLSFDCRPAPGFAGGPKEWREELKPQIDFLAQKIKNRTYLNSGMFVLVANPLDAMLISNIDWQFRSGAGASIDGVDVDYGVGTFVGANSYKIIASVNVDQGGMFLLFIPSSEKQMTYKYYPYAFNTESGYIDSNLSKVPSLMMTKRHEFAEMLPAIALINVVNNDGVSQFASYVVSNPYGAKDWDAVINKATGT